jgi:hypothetical protein
MYTRRVILGVAAIVLAVWAGIVLLGRQRWLTAPDEVARSVPNGIRQFLADIPHGSVILFALPMVVIAGHGVAMGWRKASKLRPYRGRTESDGRYRRALNDPAGLAIAWSAVYGALYMGLAVVISVARGLNPPLWEGTAAAVSLVLGWMFLVVSVYMIFWLRERRLVTRLAAGYATSLKPVPSMKPDRSSKTRTTTQTTEEEEPSFDKFTIALLKKIGEESTYLIKSDKSLTLRGREVAARALAKSDAMQLSGRTVRPAPPSEVRQ